MILTGLLVMMTEDGKMSKLEDMLDLLNAAEDVRKAYLDTYDFEIVTSEKIIDGVQTTSLTTILFGILYVFETNYR